MNLAQYLSLAGLLLDLIGAGVVASGVVWSRKRAEEIAATKWDSNFEFAKELISQRNKVLLGTSLLVMGVALQAAAQFVGTDTP